MSVQNFLTKLARLAASPDQWSRAVARFRQAIVRESLMGAVRRFARVPAVSDISYQQWIRRWDRPLSAGEVADRLAELSDPPLISVLMPVWNPDPGMLEAAISSVLAQHYPHWELHIVDNGSSRTGVASSLERFAALDDRIVLLRLGENLGISGGTNRALSIANGAYVAFLDHDDILAPTALLFVAEAAAAAPSARLFYSDEDKIDGRGKRSTPYFKPDFDGYLLLAQNYMAHFVVVETGLARMVGGLRESFDGAQDHDFLLRCTERLSVLEIVHLPYILYHWRIHAGSTAAAVDAKSYALEAGDRAVRDHLARTGKNNVDFKRLQNGYRQLRFRHPEQARHVTVIVPTRDRCDLLATCIESLFARTDYPNFDVMVIDNESREPHTLDYLANLSKRFRNRIKIMPYMAPFNYADMNNRAAARARGELLCFMNNDIEIVDGDWLSQMAGALNDEAIAAVGVRLLYPDGRVQHNGILVGFGGSAVNLGSMQHVDDPGYFGQMQLVREMTAVTAACLLTGRDEFLALGGFDGNNFPVAFNDVDYCLRLRALGRKILVTPAVSLVHHESATLGIPSASLRSPQYAVDRERFGGRWEAVIPADPAYNINLDLAQEPFTLAAVPRRQQGKPVTAPVFGEKSDGS